MRKIPFFLILLVFGLFSAEGGAKPASDFYKILGVSPGASSDKLAKAYRRVKRRLRSSPPGSLESSKRLEELEEAYGALRDPRRRAEYDSWLKKAGFQEEPNFYRLFGVLSDSPAAKITRAYREIRQRIHPDKNKGDPEATRRFQELQEAHRVLSDPRLRLRHDRELRSFEGNLLERPAGEASGKEPSRGASGKEPARGVSGKEPAQEAPGKKPARGASKGRAVKGRAEFHKTAARLQEEESLDQTLFNKEIFQLARELEAAGGEENIREAVSWYRFLAAEGDVRAARRLAPLLEDIDMEEALYRYRQGSADDSDREFSRAAVFREAQLYLNGVYEGDKAIIPKDPEKASAAFERAFELGAPRGAVAREYELIRDYEKAMEWRRQNRKPPASRPKSLKKRKAKPAGGLADFTWRDPFFSERRNQGFPEEEGAISAAIRSQNPFAVPHSEKEEKVLAMARRLIEMGLDINKAGFNEITPVMLAVRYHYFRVVQLLISAGADVHLADSDGDTVLNNAIISWDYSDFSYEFCITCKEYGKARKKYQTGLSGEEAEAQRQIIFSLVEKTDLSLRDKEGSLPLQMALERRNHSETAVWILQKMGRQKILREREKARLIDLAVKKGHAEALPLLQEAPVNEAPAPSSAPFQFFSWCRRAIFAG